MYGTYLRLGLNVADSNRAVIYAASCKLRPSARRDPALRHERHKFYKIMLRYHREANDLYRDVMRGELSGE